MVLAVGLTLGELVAHGRDSRVGGESVRTVASAKGSNRTVAETENAREDTDAKDSCMPLASLTKKR